MTAGIAIAAAALLALQAAAAVAGEEGQEPAAVVGVEVHGTTFQVRLADGRALGPRELVGATLAAADEAGRSLTVRVDAVTPDPRDPAGEVLLYQMMALGADGAWRELCDPDPAGERWAFPLAGRWTASGEHLPAAPGVFNVTCSSGAVGKCVRFGYKPWATGPDGTLLWAHHQACVRMMRADYCGDGRSFTRDGTLIDLYDRLGLQRDEPGPGMRFEAGWGADGATCVARVRIPENATLEGLARRCPGRLAEKVGAACTEEEARRSHATLLLNKS